MKTLEKCKINCLEELYLNKYKCLPNPYINEEYVFIDINRDLNICENNSMNFNIDSEFCDKHCVRNCIEEYHKLDFDYQFSFKGKDSEITVKYDKSPEFRYIAERKLSFVLFLSNIGGLFGLWFGLAFIDVSKLIKPILRFIFTKIYLLFVTFILNI